MTKVPDEGSHTGPTEGGAVELTVGEIVEEMGSSAFSYSGIIVVVVVVEEYDFVVVDRVVPSLVGYATDLHEHDSSNTSHRHASSRLPALAIAINDRPRDTGKS